MSEYTQQQPHPRAEQIELAFVHADDDFIEKYTRFVIVFADVHFDFIAGEVTEQFEKRHFKLDDRQKKALGGLYQRLLKSGEIVKTGTYRSRNQGNASAVYARKR